MVLSDLNLLVISSFVPIASILPSLIAMAVALSKELFTVYIVASVIIESTVVLSFFKQETRENKTKITYKVSYCGLDGLR
jgi:hypothetical protein